MPNWTNTQFGIGIVLSYALVGVVLLILPNQENLVGIILLSIAGVVAVITSFIYWDERKGLTACKKIYLKFIKDMYKEGLEIRNFTSPKLSNSKYARFWRRFFPYKYPTEQKIIYAQVNHYEWRGFMKSATEYIFSPPKIGFSVSSLFERQSILVLRNRGLREDLDILENILINNPIIFISFSSKFKRSRSPQDLFHFRDQYLKKKIKL